METKVEMGKVKALKTIGNGISMISLFQIVLHCSQSYSLASNLQLVLTSGSNSKSLAEWGKR